MRGNFSPQLLQGYGFFCVLVFSVSLCLCGEKVLAQNVRGGNTSDGVVLSRSGAPAPGALVYVCPQPATVSSSGCTPTPTLCSSLTDVSCTQPNPVQADGLGNYHFYVPSASIPYTLCFVGSTLTTSCLPDQGTAGGGGGGGGCANCALQTLGNLTTTALNVPLNFANTTNPLVTGNYALLTATSSSAGQLAFGMGTFSSIPGLGYSYNGGGQNVLATLTSSISGQAGTAVAAASTPQLCGANFFTQGILANFNAVCIQENFIGMQTLTLSQRPVAASNILNIWGDRTTGGVLYNFNGGANFNFGAYGNLFNQDTDSSGGGAANVLEEVNGTNPEAFRVYQTLSSSSSYSRMQMYYDSSSGDFTLSSDAGSSGGTLHSLGFRVGSSVKLEVTTTGTPVLRPQFSFDQNAGLGDATHRWLNLYLGTGGLFVGSTTVGATSTTSAASGGLMVAGTVSASASQPLCTDASGNKTITTSGCPAGTGTVTSVTFTGDGVVDSSTPSTAVTASGTVTATIKTQTANTVLAGPTTGSAASAAFRALVSADIPNNAANTSGSAGSLSGPVGASFSVSVGSTSLAGTDFLGVFKTTTAITVANIEAAAGALGTCSTNPTITFYDCGSSASCTSPTTIGSVTVSAASTVTNGTVSSASVAAGHFVVGQLTAGSCVTLASLSASLAY